VSSLRSEGADVPSLGDVEGDTVGVVDNDIAAAGSFEVASTCGSLSMCC
jgi:hypothetical protein